ncbi:universal stress protein [Pararhodobacter sp. SW119]|uniref:universal stress protein n=1 Tax=Pararhodobacter sp. SW119 TaxID=2780075 RepID=UPI001ADF7DF3|nr:universal stress protein [Pararhodobacter sp. SW119]
MPKTILLPIDMSDEASWRKSLAEALTLLHDGGVLHVATVLPDFGLVQVSGFFSKDFEREALHQMGVELTEWVNAHVPREVEVHPHVLHGKIYDEILRAADKLGADVIVMGSHRPEFKDYLLGPNAARVMRHARQSVYIVRN